MGQRDGLAGWTYYIRPEKPPAEAILKEGPENTAFLKVIKNVLVRGWIKHKLK